MADSSATPTVTEADPKVIEGMQLALNHIVSYGSKLGRSVTAYPGNRDGVSHAAYELFVEIQQLKGIKLDSEAGEAAYREYMLAWRNGGY
jgi:hypothetical protein